jgi:TetR/AcrR family transcriptional repressor of nem operon
MRVTRHTRTEHGDALLTAASRLFREKGLSAVGVADISAAAGLTHGAFYGHYPSKAAVAEAACRGGLARGADAWRARAARARAAGADPLHAIFDHYLAERHRDTPAEGCVLASLGGEISRADPKLRAALHDGTALLADVLRDELAARHPDWSDTDTATAAEAVLTALVGGLLLARTYAADPERSRAALAAASRLARHAADTVGKD